MWDRLKKASSNGFRPWETAKALASPFTDMVGQWGPLRPAIDVAKTGFASANPVSGFQMASDMRRYRSENNLGAWDVVPLEEQSRMADKYIDRDVAMMAAAPPFSVMPGTMEAGRAAMTDQVLGGFSGPQREGSPWMFMQHPLVPKQQFDPTTVPMPPASGVVPNAVDAGQDAYQQYLDRMTDEWRLQQQAIENEYDPYLSQSQDKLADLQARENAGLQAFNDYQAGMNAINTDIPYGAIADLDTSRVKKEFDESEGRLAQALNIMPDELSDQLVGELRYFEDVTETMLGDDIENIDKLHDLSAVYAQSIADDVYGQATLEGQRAKLEMQADFDRQIIQQKRAVERQKVQREKALEQAAKKFQLQYPEFEMDRDTITQATFMNWATQDGGYSREDASQAWQMYQNVYKDHAGEIATQADFDRLLKESINSQNMTLLSPEIAANLKAMWDWDPEGFDESDPASLEQKMQWKAAKELQQWMQRYDVASMFNDSDSTLMNQQLKEMGKLMQKAGFTEEQVDSFMERGVDASAEDAMFSYRAPEAVAARQAYQTTDEVDDHWEEIYWNSMTIPVDSQYVHVNPQTEAFYPVAGPGVAFNDVGFAQAQQGTPIVSAFRGKVEEVGYDQVRGHYIVIDDGQGNKIMYSNMEDVPVFEQGATVKGGTSVGRIGNSGAQSTHDYGLHVTYWRDGQITDPRTLFGAYGADT